MTPMTFVPYDPPPQCGAKRGPKSKTVCELPLDHIVGGVAGPYRTRFHEGRDSAGRWHSWGP